MSGERAYLIYPISDIDEDPEVLLAFHGISPQARVKVGFPCHRALVTIHLLQLDSWRHRKELHKDRAEFLEKLLLGTNAEGRFCQHEIRDFSGNKSYLSVNDYHLPSTRKLPEIIQESL